MSLENHPILKKTIVGGALVGTLMGSPKEAGTQTANSDKPNDPTKIAQPEPVDPELKEKLDFIKTYLKKTVLPDKELQLPEDKTPPDNIRSMQIPCGESDDLLISCRVELETDPSDKTDENILFEQRIDLPNGFTHYKNIQDKKADGIIITEDNYIDDTYRIDSIFTPDGTIEKIIPGPYKPEANSAKLKSGFYHGMVDCVFNYLKKLANSKKQ